MNAAVSGYVTSIASWVMRLAFLNLLWVMFTLAGGIVLGVFPATTAGYQLLRNRMRTPSEWEEPLLPAYWALVRKRILSSNAAGYGLVVVGLLLLAALRLSWSLSGSVWQLPLTAVSVIAAIAFVGTVVQLPFLAAQLEARPLLLLAASWSFAMAHPLSTLAVVAAMIGQSYLLGALPAAAVFFLFSPIAALTVALGLRGYAQTERRAALAPPAR